MERNLYKNRIVADPKVMVGKPIIKGTRITVELILRLLASGMTIKEITLDYPHLREADVQATLGYASKTFERIEKVVEEDDIFSPPPTRSIKRILKELQNTKKYSYKFLESLERGLGRSLYFNANPSSTSGNKKVSKG